MNKNDGKDFNLRLILPGLPLHVGRYSSPDLGARRPVRLVVSLSVRIDLDYFPVGPSDGNKALISVPSIGDVNMPVILKGDNLLASGLAIGAALCPEGPSAA